MIRVLAFFAAGILLAIYFPGFIELTSAIVICISLIGCFFLTTFLSPSRKRGLLAGWLGLVAMALFGYAHLLLKIDSGKDGHILQLNDTIKAYTAFVRSVPESKSRSWKIAVEIQAIKTSTWQPASGKVLLYVSKKIASIHWRYGDQLLIKGSPQLLKSPANPGEFDFRRFLSLKNIYHQQFVLPHQVQWLSDPERKGFIYYSHRAREWSLKHLNLVVDGEQQQAIAAALVLGVTDGIDTDLISAYSASGAMHVLAVSGLHVGIIYAILLLLLKPLNRFAWSRWVVAIISLSCLWVFAFVTGLSPSVLRAVVMFSFVAIARPFGKRTNIYNTLAASAFVLLLHNPYLIMSVGFQLSYLAVLGIVYLQRPIYNLWEIDNRVGDWIWQISCISIAAQIATFPLGLLYFHQFPVYFLISNLFVIPLSTGVLVLGVLVLVVSYITPVAWLIGKLLTWAIWLLNWTVFATEKLPFSLISGIHISTLQCLLLMGAILSVALLFQFRSLKWAFIATTVLLFFSMLRWIDFQAMVNKDQFVVYSISGHRAYDFTSKGKSYFIADSSLLTNTDLVRFHIMPNRLLNSVVEVFSGYEIPFKRQINGIDFYEWNSKSIAVISGESKLPVNLQVDYLVIGKNSFRIQENQVKNFQIGQLVLDGSNTRYYSKQLSKFASSKGIPFHFVLDHGAFVLNN
jgi:competence protein ComEC